MTHYAKFLQLGNPRTEPLEQAPSLRWLAFIREAEAEGLVRGHVGGTDEANPPYAVLTPKDAAAERELRKLARKHGSTLRKGEPRGIRLGWA